MNFFSQYFSAIRKSGLALLVVYALYTISDQGLTYVMEQNLRSPEGANSWVFIYGAVYLANSIFFTTLIALVCLFGVAGTGKMTYFVRENLNQSCIEVVRSWGKTLMWSLLLIIPGILKYLQFLFVPFVVALFPAYRQGRVDALETSKKFFKKRWGAVVLALAAFQLIWASISTGLFDSYRLVWQTPMPALLISSLEAFVFLLYILVLFRIFSQSLREVTNESAV